MSDFSSERTAEATRYPDPSILTTLLHEVQVNSLETNRYEPVQALVELAGVAELLVYQAAVVPLSIWSAIKDRQRGDHHA